MNRNSRQQVKNVVRQSASSFDLCRQPTAILKVSLQNDLTSGGRLSSRKRKPLNRPVILCCCLGLLILLVSLFGFTFYLYQNYSSEYHRDMILAREGVQHLQTAEGLIKQLARGSFDANGVLQVKQEFSDAFTTFSQIRNDMEQIPGIATDFPKYGSMLDSALKLVPLALEISQVGILGCDALSILISGLHGSLAIKAQGITLADLTMLKKDVAEIQGILNTAAYQVSQLQPSDLRIDARLGPAVTAFRAELPAFQTSLQNIQSMLGAAPQIFGISQPASFLIEQLDSTEVRPGGGFIGSYGIATLSGGQLTSIHMTDTYLLDKPFEYAGHTIPYPPAYQWFKDYLAPASWSLRDSNLDADFPTAARYAEQIYHTEGGTVPLQGIIAITPWLIENALKITGPITIPEYHETITAQNLVDRIHYHQLQEEGNGGDVPSPDGHSSVRKRFTELLFEHFFDRVRQIWPTAASQFVTLFRNSLSTKDIQVYFNSVKAESLLQYYHDASSIQSPQSDSLFVVDADVSGGKPNNFIQYTLEDDISIDSSGNAMHKATLTYNWPVSANPFQNGFGYQSLYHDYVRIYTPPGSSLLMQSGWQPEGTSTAFGREVWAGLLVLPYGQSRTITLSWVVHGAAIKDGNGWHYYDLVQRQAGITWRVKIQVSLPACSHSANTPDKLTSGSQHVWTLNQMLSADHDIGVNYRC